MKPLRELKFEELTVKQKLGLIHTPRMSDDFPKEAIDYICNQIRSHSLGAVWIQFSEKNSEKYMKMVREIADYPILIITDAESGIGEYMIGRSNPIACTGDERYAYAFGKVTAFQAHEMGYNVVCHPLLDISNDGSPRLLGSNKHIIAKMCAAIAQGVHDAGVLTIGKHYPSGTNVKGIDSHMAESYSEQTESDLLENGLFAYLELMKKGLLDGVMTGHKKFPNIDPRYPASLSKPMIDIIRNQGFDGLAITDALMMMGIRANYGDDISGPLCIAAGNDLALPYHSKVQLVQESLYDAYEKGIITEDRLDEAVKRVLAAQHKVMLMEQTRAKTITAEEKELVRNINRDSIYAQTDEGLTASISKNGKHLFALMVRNEESVGIDGGVPVDTFSNHWLYPRAVAERLTDLFPHSIVKVFHQFPSASQNMHILNASAECEDVIFLTFSEPLAYAGGEYITERVVSLMRSMQYTNKISTLVHFGNPCILHSLPHIPRYILGGISTESVNACLDILAGTHEAKGVKSYDFKLN